MRPYQSEWFRPKTAAKYLDSSDSTLAKMRLRCDGPPYSKLGARLVRYNKGDLDAYLAARARNSTSEGD
jgi:predicted DNA-binding transcriptional regulator AlpA